jgi:hypothetical protein
MHFVYNFRSEIEIDIGTACMINRQSVTLFHRKPASSIWHFYIQCLSNKLQFSNTLLLLIWLK